MVNQAFVGRIFRFGFVGGAVLVIFVGLNKLFSQWTSETVAFLLSYPLAVAVHFFLSKRWTFACDRQDMKKQIGEYLIVVALTFLIQYSVFHLTFVTWGWHHLLAAGFANVSQMVVGFLMYSRRVFSGSRSATLGS